MNGTKDSRGVDATREALPFAGFLRYSSAFRDNFQTRYFVGHTVAVKPDGEPTEADLMRAMCRLWRFDVVLRLERDLDLLGRGLGFLRKERMGTRNHADDELPSLPAATLELLRAKTRLDERL